MYVCMCVCIIIIKFTALIQCQLALANQWFVVFVDKNQVK